MTKAELKQEYPPLFSLTYYSITYFSSKDVADLSNQD